METKLNAYNAVLSKAVELVALVGGKPRPNLVSVKAEPVDWHGGHPLGAVLMKPIDVDCSTMKRAMTIDGWRIVCVDGNFSDEPLPSPIRLEPQVMMRLERCAIVRRSDPDGNSSAAPAA